MYDIGILVPCYNINEDEKSRWLNLINTYNQYNIKIELADYISDNNPIFSKSYALNIGLLKLINECDIIIQTDIDCIFEEELLSETITQCNIYDFCFNRCRYSDVYHLDWKTYINLPTLKQRGYKNGSGAEGCWNAAKSSIWKLIGGWNDELYGYGGEDIDLRWRIQNIYNLKIHELRDDIALVHINHPKRKWNIPDINKKNHKVVFGLWDSWKKDKVKCPNFLEKYIKP